VASFTSVNEYGLASPTDRRDDNEEAVEARRGAGSEMAVSRDDDLERDRASRETPRDMLTVAERACTSLRWRRRLQESTEAPQMSQEAGLLPQAFLRARRSSSERRNQLTR
jgi:hypothetical protein